MTVYRFKYRFPSVQTVQEDGPGSSGAYKPPAPIKLVNTPTLRRVLGLPAPAAASAPASYAYGGWGTASSATSSSIGAPLDLFGGSMRFFSAASSDGMGAGGRASSSSLSAPPRPPQREECILVVDDEEVPKDSPRASASGTTLASIPSSAPVTHVDAYAALRGGELAARVASGSALPTMGSFATIAALMAGADAAQRGAGGKERFVGQGAGFPFASPAGPTMFARPAVGAGAAVKAGVSPSAVTPSFETVGSKLPAKSKRKLEAGDSEAGAGGGGGGARKAARKGTGAGGEGAGGWEHTTAALAVLLHDPAISAPDDPEIASFSDVPWLSRKSAVLHRVWGMEKDSGLGTDAIRHTLFHLGQHCDVDLSESTAIMAEFCAEATTANEAASRTRARALAATGSGRSGKRPAALPCVTSQANLFNPAFTPPDASLVSISLALVGDRACPKGLVAAVLLVRSRSSGTAGMSARTMLLPLTADSLVRDSLPGGKEGGEGDSGRASRMDCWQCLNFLLNLSDLPVHVWDAKGAALHALSRSPVTTGQPISSLFDPLVASFMLSPDTWSATNAKDRSALPSETDSGGFDPIGAEGAKVAGPTPIKSGGIAHRRLDAGEELDLVFIATAYGVSLPPYLQPHQGQFVTAHLSLLAATCDMLGSHLVARGMAPAFQQQEMPLLAVLAQLETTGVACDVRKLEKWGRALGKASIDLDASIRRMAGSAAGPDLNLASPKQLAELLYDRLGLPVPGNDPRLHNKASTKSSQAHPSTAEDELLELAPKYPICSLILKWRKLQKGSNTFVKGFSGELARARSARGPSATLETMWGAGAGEGGEVAIDVEDGDECSTHALPCGLGPATAGLARAFCSLRQTSVGTGRLSAADPNLQQLPNDDPSSPGSDSAYVGILDAPFRTAIVASGPRAMLLSMDYSQIEVRILAFVSGDAALQRVFRQSATAGRAGDVYAVMASAAFGVPLPSVSPSQRKQAKTACLAMIYGEGPPEMAKKLGITSQEGSRLQASFNRSYPRVGAWMKLTAAFAEKYGHTLTLTGRRRLNPELKRMGASFTVRSYGHRKAINSVIQGSAADLMKLAMVGVHKLLHVGSGEGSGSGAGSAPQGRLLLSIHDELMLEGPDDPVAIRALAKAVQRVMIHEAPLELERLCRAALQLPLLSGDAAALPGDAAALPGDAGGGGGSGSSDALWEAYRIDAATLLGMQAALGLPGGGMFAGIVEGTITRAVPLTVSTQVGSNWGRMAPLEV